MLSAALPAWLPGNFVHRCSRDQRASCSQKQEHVAEKLLMCFLIGRCYTAQHQASWRRCVSGRAVILPVPVKSNMCDKLSF